MPQPTEDEIAIRAFELWIKNGRPEGDEKKDAFWHEAKQELRNEDKGNSLRTPDTL